MANNVEMDDATARDRLPPIRIELNPQGRTIFADPFDFMQEVTRCKNVNIDMLRIPRRQEGVFFLATDDKQTHEELSKPWPESAFKGCANFLNAKPSRQGFRVVMRMDISFDIEKERVIKAMKDQGIEDLVCSYTRDKKPTTYVRGNVLGKDKLQELLKQGVRLACTLIRVEEDKPLLMCHNCQQFGHKKAECTKKKPTCLRCGGAHTHKECTVEAGNRQELRCANCGGAHASVARDCPYVQQATRLAKQNMPYNDYAAALKGLTARKPANTSSKAPLTEAMRFMKPAAKTPSSMITEPMKQVERASVDEISVAIKRAVEEARIIFVKEMEAERAKVARDAATNAVAELSKKNDQLVQQCAALRKRIEQIEQENKTLKETMTERLVRIEKNINNVLNEQTKKVPKGKRVRTE